METRDRERISSHITRSRFLHVEDALAIDKIRFFIGEYQKGQGAQATAYHFLDDADARPIMADLSWSKAIDRKDYKGSANGGQPLSRVLKIRGPKDGKYWLEIQNGPGEIIGAGAVKPAGEPDASISIALSISEARKLALAVIEYMTAYRVAALIRALNPFNPLPESVDSAPDAEALFGPEPAAAHQNPPAPRPQSEPKKAKEENKPTTFYALAPEAVTKYGLLEIVQGLIKAPISWTEKSVKLQQAMMDATAA